MHPDVGVAGVAQRRRHALAGLAGVQVGDAAAAWLHGQRDRGAGQQQLAELAQHRDRVGPEHE
ncbi:MAG TPA: hypothetical protein VF486_24190, partial [Actinomycetes bacterium]